jgi:3-dehydroquinate synthase
MQRLRVKSKYFAYDVVVGRGAWKALRAFVEGGYSSIFIVTERPIWRRWGKAFVSASGLKSARVLYIPSGEDSKSLEMVEQLSGRLLAERADRRSLLVAFGGGVAGDLAGFVASTYMRGIALVQVPTTVVAQVDSAIGGKTAVNVGAMKNLVGTFYPPRLVAAEPLVLTSLGERGFHSGLYEVAKHAILSGEKFFARFNRALDSIRPARAQRLGGLLSDAARVKVNVVNRDERESRLRMVLNLGHTFGHALEEATDYKRFMHGEAVGWGLLAAIRLGELLGRTPAAEAKRMSELVWRVGPLPSIGDLSAARVVKLLARDKKAVANRLHWVIPERIGRVKIVTDVPERTAAEAFRDIQRAAPHA